jgi:molybdopterin converting factor small subunit
MDTPPNLFEMISAVSVSLLLFIGFYVLVMYLGQPRHKGLFVSLEFLEHQQDTIVQLQEELKDERQRKEEALQEIRHLNGIINHQPMMAINQDHEYVHENAGGLTQQAFGGQ